MEGARLYVCETCVRDRSPGPDESSLGRQLGDAVDRLLADRPDAGSIALRRVHCLNGCPSPCNVALRGRGKWGYRFSRLQSSNAEAVVTMALAYAASDEGDVPESDWPEDLRGKATVRTPPIRTG